jgi:hypothetical protein
MLSERGQSAGHSHSEQVFKTSSSPVGLYLDTPWTLNATMLNSRRFLDRLRLGPRRHSEQQHFFQRPDVIGQASRHRWRTRPPHLGRALAVGRNWLRSWLTQARMGQDEIVIHLEEHQLLTQSVFALTRGRAASPHRRDPLT